MSAPSEGLRGEQANAEAIRVSDLPLWPEAPFASKIDLARFEIRHGEAFGKRLAVVIDKEHSSHVAGPEDGWSDEILQTAMENLCGATFIRLYGFDAMLEVVKACKITPRARSAHAQHLISQQEKLYSWRSRAAASSP